MGNWFKKILPSRNTVRTSIFSGKLRQYLASSSLWRFNNDSVSRGTAVGLFAAAFPLMPLQTFIAALLAVVIRANLPIAVALSWISNPLTIIPITYFTYFIGSCVLGESDTHLSIHAYAWKGDFWSSLTAWFFQFGKAFFVGLPIVSVGIALLGYVLVNLCWRMAGLVKNRKHRS